MKRILMLVCAGALISACCGNPQDVPGSLTRDGAAVRLDVSSFDCERYLVCEGRIPAQGILVNGRAVKPFRADVAPGLVNLTGWLVPGANRIDLPEDAGAALLEGRKIYFAPDTYGRDRLKLIQVDVSEVSATLHLKGVLRNGDVLPRSADVHIALKDAEGAVVLERSVPVSLAQRKGQPFVEALTLSEPHLWKGASDPYLYTLEVSTGTDFLSIPFGFRSRDGADSLGEIADIQADPVDWEALAACDREGRPVRLCLPETAGAPQLSALIADAYNHPSVVAWAAPSDALVTENLILDPYRPIDSL